MKLKESIGGEVVLNTDEYTIYQGIEEVEAVKEHGTVNHSRAEWARGEAM